MASAFAAERLIGATPALLLAALTIHNVPEGLAVGVAFAAGGTELGVPDRPRHRDPDGFAAGAMRYVVVDELIPESHPGGHELDATLALLPDTHP